MSGVKYKEHIKASRNRKRLWLRKLKDGPCIDCGQRFPPPIMEWDHVRGEKEFGLADTIANNISRERILKEIEKCELVCANCHRLRHMAA